MVRIASEEYNLQVKNPSLAGEWHPTRNGKITPCDVTPNSGKKVWWVCREGHEWEATIGARNNGTGCPYCSGRAAWGRHCLQAENPQLAQEWHPTKNGSLTPRDVKSQSNKKVWWLCAEGHEWQAVIASRFYGTGCPYCTRRVPSAENSLQATNPILAKEWHPTLNRELKPQDVLSGSGKRVWWLCAMGHKWKASVKDRNNGRGCPYCSGRAVCEDNCLQTLNPSLASEWLSEKNGPLTPNDVTLYSHTKVWWKCNVGHEWEARVSKRSKGNGCPYCSGNAVCDDNCLETLNPELARQWHPAKNGKLTPREYTSHSNKKVWWKCNRGHEWEASISDRSRGTGCPYCNSQTSQLELRVYCEMKYVFRDVQHKKKVYGKECDIYIPDLKFAIELDGAYWHKDKFDHDKRKTLFLERKGITLLRVREYGLDRISELDFFFSPKDGHLRIVQGIMRRLAQYAQLTEPYKNRVEKYLRRKKLANSTEYQHLLAMLPSPLADFSLESLNPVLSREWHPKLNGSLTPADVSPGSGMKVWWRCVKGHEWEATIGKRNNGTGCPYCAGQAVSDDNCLQFVNLGLSKEWHPSLNESLTPRDVTANSGKRVWWLCAMGHEWEATIGSRNNGKGCPYCAGRAVSEDNCLATINPTLSIEWHPKLNGSLTPADVSPGSRMKVWWRCVKGHEWEATIGKRNNGTGCPYCAGQAVSDDNCLQFVNPTLSKEWHPTKNESLTPRDVTANSGKKVWWRCIRGHEWEATIYGRNYGAGCPKCFAIRWNKR